MKFAVFDLDHTLLPVDSGENWSRWLVRAAGMDVALTVAQLLRAEGVVGCFVEAFGPGVATLSATQRSCVANMTPEYGSTCTLFPADDVALDYLSLVGRDPSEVAFTREFLRVQGVSGDAERTYAKVLDLDLSDVRPWSPPACASASVPLRSPTATTTSLGSPRSPARTARPTSSATAPSPSRPSPVARPRPTRQ